MKESESLMELQDFVAATLKQIVKGMQSAQDDVRASGGFVSPPLHGKGESHFGTMRGGQPVLLIDFDVAVLAESGGGTNAGMGITVAGFFKAGAGGASTSREQTTSRIKFQVPLAFPVDPEARREAEEFRQRQDAKVRGGHQGSGSWMNRY